MSYRPSRLIRAIPAAVLMSLASASTAVAAPGVPETKTLANGLKVVILEDHSLPLVSVSLWVHAGSKDEIDTSAGYAHFLEHLVQRGTDTSGPFEYQRLAHRWGGSLTVRASYDRTYITATGVPSVLDQIVDGIAAMALRAKLDGKEIDQELVTLTQEVRKYYDEPSSVAFLESVRAAFPKHPYRFPPLGNLKSIGSLKHEALAAFYSNLYVPNNMALVFAGDLDPARARELAERFFGKATSSATLPPKPALPSGFAGHEDKEKPLDLKASWTTLTFVGPGYRHPDRPAFEVLARALGDAGGSRILGALARDRTGSSAQVTYYRLEDAGLMYISMTPSEPGQSYAAASAALEEIAALKKRGLREDEVKALVQGYLKEARIEAEHLDSLTEALGEAALLGGTRYYWDLPDQLGRLNAAEVNRVAAKYLVAENLKLVVIVPKGTAAFTDEQKEGFHKALDALGGMAKDAPPADFEKRLYADGEATRVRSDAWGDPRDASARRTPVRSSLDNGLALVVQEDHRRALAAVSLHLSFGSGDDPSGKEGLAYVAGRFLSTAPVYPGKGDVLRVGEKTILLPEVQVSRDLTEARFLSSPADLRAGLAALASLVKQPEVTEAAFEGVRKGTREALDRAGNDPSFVALELFREKVYAGHAYAHPAVGTASGLGSLTRTDLVAFLKRGFRPGGAALAIAGDVNSGEIQKWVRDLFGPWKGETEPSSSAKAKGPQAPAGLPDSERPGALPPLSRNPANAAAAPGEFTRLLSIPQSSVLVGVPGPSIGDADFDDLRILGAGLTILSFEEMIFKRRAAFTSTVVPEALREGGAFAIVVVAQHARRDEAVFEVQRQMRRLALEDLDPKDLEDFARVESGRESAALQGVLPAASSLAYRVAAGLGVSPPQKGAAASGLTPKHLKDLAGRYLGPGSWIVIRVGPSGP